MKNVTLTQPTEVKPHPPKILLVEDEAIVAMDMELILKENGYAVCGTADNGADAIALARSKKPDLILMDIVIKGKMDGVDTAKWISHGLNIPVIYLTAYNDAHTVDRATRTGPYGYLTKPFQAKEIRAAIEVALYKAALERQLRDSEQWFASTLRCIADSVIGTDVQERINFMNPAAEALLKWPLNEAMGRDITEVVPLENNQNGAPVESPVHLAMSRNTTVGIDFGTIVASRDGQKTPIDDAAAPIRSEDGKTLGAVLVFRDVRERITAEEKLRQSEERFRSAFDFAPVGMALVSLENRFLQVNGALCRLLGRSEENLIGTDQTQISGIEELASERALLYELLTGHTVSVQFEKRYRTKDSQEIYTQTSVSLLRQNNGEPLCYLVQIHDLTAQKAVEYELAQLAHLDPLTGLANRARLGTEIERQIVAARRHRQQLGCCIPGSGSFQASERQPWARNRRRTTPTHRGEIKVIGASNRHGGPHGWRRVYCAAARNKYA